MRALLVATIVFRISRKPRHKMRFLEIPSQQAQVSEQSSRSDRSDGFLRANAQPWALSTAIRSSPALK